LNFQRFPLTLPVKYWAVNQIIQATSDSEILAVRQLFEEYAASLAIDLGFQHFADELASLPGAYAPPRGALFLARADGSAAGCIGLRPFSDSVGELKRLYVVPALRGHGLARSLVSSAIEAARSIGYRALVLDTLASMRPAIALYESFGFQRTEPYYPNPLPEVVYFRMFITAYPPQTCPAPGAGAR
jgi:ribosomal protein S18 acetylase RimI-like enzyme